MAAGKNTQLPEEICFDILERLPVKSLGRFKAVSKPWKFLVSSPDFIDCQYDRSAANCSKLAAVEERCSESEKKCSILLHTLNSNPASPVETTTIEQPTKYEGKCISSCWCRGLLLTEVTNGPSFKLLLWNPLTKECKEVPKPVPYRYIAETSAIGYDFTMRSHMIVIILRKSNRFNQISVYTCKTNSWAFFEVVRDNTASICSGPLTLVNGAPHWLVEYGDDDDYNDNNNYYAIEYFDFSMNKLMEVPQPGDYAYRNYSYVHPELYDMEGCLCIGYYTHEDANEVEIWVMKQYGVKETWSKLMIFDVYNDILNISRFPLCFAKNNVNVSLVNEMGIMFPLFLPNNNVNEVGMERDQGCVALYNGKERRAELRIPASQVRKVRAFAFVESLISD